MADYEIRPLAEGDEHSLLETFEAVFGVKRSLAEWEWAFRKNPAGYRSWVGVYEGRVVAQFAGSPMRMWVDGTEQTFVHAIDSMTHPEHRRGLKRPGLFVTVARTCFDTHGGIDGDWVYYGLPVEQAARVGSKFLGYEVVRNQIMLARHPDDGPTTPPPEVERLQRFDHQARWVFDRCCGRWPAAGIRDDRYLNWRFLEHPTHRYVPFGVFDADRLLRGVAVYRHASWLLENVGFLVDWLVPPEEPEVGDLLVEAVLAQARADRAQAVAASFPEWSPWFESFQEKGFLVHPTEYEMHATTFHPKRGPTWLRDNWWYQPGDTDLV